MITPGVTTSGLLLLLFHVPMTKPDKGKTANAGRLIQIIYSFLDLKIFTTSACQTDQPPHHNNPHGAEQLPIFLFNRTCSNLSEPNGTETPVLQKQLLQKHLDIS